MPELDLKETLYLENVKVYKYQGYICLTETEDRIKSIIILPKIVKNLSTWKTIYDFDEIYGTK
jgi:hypothetical protein